MSSNACNNLHVCPALPSWCDCLYVHLTIYLIHMHISGARRQHTGPAAYYWTPLDPIHQSSLKSSLYSTCTHVLSHLHVLSRSRLLTHPRRFATSHTRSKHPPPSRTASPPTGPPQACACLRLPAPAPPQLGTPPPHPAVSVTPSPGSAALVTWAVELPTLAGSQRRTGQQALEHAYGGEGAARACRGHKVREA